jgi:hypothetical protein
MKVKFKNAKILTIATLTITMLLVSTCTFSSATTATPKIYLEPSNNIYTTDTAYVGMKFNVTVWCADIPKAILGAQITLHFNDTILNVTAWYVPSLSDPNFFYYGATKITTLPDPPDPGYVHVGAGHGYIKVAVSNGYLPPKAPWGHNGTIAIIEFIITAAPTVQGKYSSTLGINNDDTYIRDTSNVNIDVTKEDGYYEIRKLGPMYSLTISTTSGGTTDPVPGIWTYESGTIVPVTAIPATNYILDHWELDSSWNYSNPINVIMNSNHALHAVFVFSPPEGSRIFVDPPETVIPHAVPCQTNFNINVSIDDIAEMKTCEFNLTYNTNIISIIGLNFLSINEQYPTLNLIANDTAGFIWMKLAYSTPITVSSPTPLTTLTFHVDNLGATPLNLTNTKIMDTYGNPIPHDVYDGFFMAAIRNVAVTDIMLSRTWAYPGWPINITVTVKNKGTVAESFNVHAYYDSHVIGTITVTDLTPSEERDIIFEWSTTGVSEGNYTIKAEAEPVPYELDTTDNTLIDGKVWIMTHFHDVAIVSVTSESWVFQGWTVHINVTARNNGEFTESFDINAYCNTTLIGTVHVTNLPPGNEYKAQFSLNTSILLPCHTYPIKGEATPVSFEYNETNNVVVSAGFKVRLLGDLNGDGKVDLDDVLTVSLAFGSYPGARNWNPDADTNRDNKIDLTDVLTVYINYGKTC